MIPRYENVVIVKHPRVDKTFVFRLPSAKKVAVGTYVLCDTTLGPCQMGRCITPSFVIGEWQLKEFYGISIDALKPVTHILEPVALVVQQEEEENDRDA